MRERGAERQRGPGQLRIVVQLRFERNDIRQDMFCKHSFLSFPLRPNDNASRFTAVLSTLSGDSGDRHVWDVNWNLSSLSPLSFSFYSKTQPPEQNNCRRPAPAAPAPRTKSCHEETEAGTTSTHRRCDSWLLHIYFPVRSLGMLIRLGANTTTTTSTSTNCRPPGPTAAAHLAAIVGVLLGSCARLCNEGRTSDDNVSGGDDCAVCCRWWR